MATNRELLVSVLGHPDFEAGAVSTNWLEDVLPQLSGDGWDGAARNT